MQSKFIAGALLVFLVTSMFSSQSAFAGPFDPCSGVDCNDNNPCTSDSCSIGICLNFPGNPGATCRAAAGTCDVAETCTGISSICPFDNILPPGITCRGAADACDVAETCTGSSPFCPGDGFASGTTSCDADQDVCTGPDLCDGAGVCVAGGPITGTPACFPAVGGEIIPIESTSLILAGAQTFSWMLPVVLSVLGIGLFVVSRKSE